MSQLFYPLIAQGQGGGIGELVIQLLPFAIIFGIFWFFLIRPQKKKQEEHQEFLKALKAGDRVVTAGGILGEVTSIDDEIVKLRIARDTTIKLLRNQIQGSESEMRGGDEDSES